jgi:hypothetical protein
VSRTRVTPAALALLEPGLDPGALFYSGSVAEARGAVVQSLRLCQCSGCHEFWWLTKAESGRVEAVVDLPRGGLAELWHARPESFGGYPF